MTTAHYFEITKEVWDALTVEEVIATVFDMKKMDLFRRPVDGTIIIKTPLNMPREYGGPDSEIGETETFMETVFAEETGAPTMVRVFPKSVSRATLERKIAAAVAAGSPMTYDAERHAALIKPTDLNPLDAEFTYFALIVLLASKGVEKHTKQRKLAKLGIGKKSWPPAATIISLSSSIPDDDGHRPGQPKRAHLRRGHIRQQHYGKGNAEVKSIWIAPIFVNGDPSFFEGKNRYRITR